MPFDPNCLALITNISNKVITQQFAPLCWHASPAFSHKLVDAMARKRAFVHVPFGMVADISKLHGRGKKLTQWAGAADCRRKGEAENDAEQGASHPACRTRLGQIRWTAVYLRSHLWKLPLNK